MEDDDGDYGTFLGLSDAMDGAAARHEIVRPLDTSRKWLMLALLSLLSAVNQGVCYSYAPIASIAETRWQQNLHSTELITVFFIAYIPCSFVGSWIMDKKGLRYGVLLGGALQALGATVRYLATFSHSVVLEAQLTVFGQILAAVAMPFMVNSPPVLSANWFPPSQRATSTSVAVNANAMGTALIYLTAPFIVRSIDEIPQWNMYVALVAILSAAAASVLFQSFPGSVSNSDDTESIISDVQLHDEYDWKQWGNAFLHKGFWNTVVVFSIGECIVNAISALLGKFLSTEGFSKSEIGLIGAAFIVSSLVGSQIISGYVDQRRNHQHATLVCIVLTALALAVFKSTLSSGGTLVTLTSLLTVGAFLGPLQPIVLELGVECAFPTSEATVAALQQLCGNFLSAILVPGLSAMRRAHADKSGHVPAKYFYASPEWVMVFMLVCTFIAFCFYDGEYKRFDHEIRTSPTYRPTAASFGLLDVPELSASGRTPSLLPVKVAPASSSFSMAQAKAAKNKVTHGK